MILTLDLGTSRVKAALWESEGLVELAEAALTTTSPAPGASEQDAATWWDAVMGACAALGERSPGRLDGVEAISCTGARQTFGLFDATGDPVGPAIVWSDGRSAEVGDGPDVEDGGRRAVSVVDRLAWVAATRADQLRRSEWILGPRDRVAWKLTGEVATDPTMASLTGCYRPDGTVVDEVARLVGDRLPAVVPSETVMGMVTSDVAASLGLPAGVPVVIGAGDRQCEVLGTDASATVPMVSWGTTANISMPVGPSPVTPPSGLVSTRAVSGWQLEGGTSAAGSLLSWLSTLCGRSPSELAELAAASPPGARGVTAVPWLSGARAPWWRPGARAGFVGLSNGHGPGDLARAMFESVARDVQRCLVRMDAREPAGPGVTELGLAGGAADTPVWIEVLTGTTGLPVRLRRSGQAASAGAALLGARAVDSSWRIDTLDPVVQRCAADPALARFYADRVPHDDRVAGMLIDLELPPSCG